MKNYTLKQAAKLTRKGKAQFEADTTKEHLIEVLKYVFPEDLDDPKEKFFRTWSFNYKRWQSSFGSFKNTPIIKLSQILQSKNKRIEALEKRVEKLEVNRLKYDAKECLKSFNPSFELTEASEAVKPELEVGKWSKSVENPKVKFLFNGNFGNSTNSGFSSNGIFSENGIGVHKEGRYVKMNTEEITSLLKAECEKRGIVKGARVKSVVSGIEWLIGDGIWEYNEKSDKLLLDIIGVYQKGIFAEVITPAEKPFVLPEKFAFRLDCKEAVEYANSFGIINSYGQNLMFFHFPKIGALGNAFMSLQTGYTDVTDQFKEHVYNPWKESQKEVKEEQPEEVIDWNMMQFVILENEQGKTIVKTSGNHRGVLFSGTVITTTNECNLTTHFYERWIKSKFKKLTEPITINP